MLSHPYIVVASDLSPSSDLALKAAEKLRKKSEGKLHVIHVTPYPQQWDWLTNDVVVNYYPESFKENLIEGLDNELKVQLERCEVDGKGEILMGPPAKTILDFISKNRADIAVLGHKERGHVFNLKGVAAKVMSGAQIPVLLINEDFKIERVAGLVDPLKPKKEIFSTTEELGFIYSGDLEFISVWPEDVAYDDADFPKTYPVMKLSDEKKAATKQKMAAILKENADSHSPAKLRTEISEEGKVDDLVKILNEDHIDLAVMSKHQKGRIEKFFIGSVTKGVMNNWHGNLLVLPT